MARDNRYTTIRGMRALFNKGPRETDRDIGSFNAYALSLGHYSLWKTCVDKNLPGIFVFESDVLCEEPIRRSHLTEFFKRKNPYVLMFGNYLYQDPKYDIYWQKVKERFWGTHAYFVTRDGCKRLMENFFPIDE
jgi:GR25 family glycosyltransferase involved in LPS biosynthesis